MKHVFLLGTPFSGSTILTNMLDTHPNIFAIGELERLPRFRRYEHLIATEPDIYRQDCFVCSALGKPCPIWNSETHNAISSQNSILEIHNILAERYEAAFGSRPAAVIDSSKTPDWLRFSARTVTGSDVGYRTVQDSDVAAILITKSVFGFCESMVSRAVMAPLAAAQMWCDVTTDALRVIASLSIPSIIVRYESLFDGPEIMLRRLCRFVGTEADDAIIASMQMLSGHQPHGIGGNESAYRSYVGDGSISILDTIDRRRWIKNLSDCDVELIATARGVHDLSHELGYNLDNELKLYRSSARAGK